MGDEEDASQPETAETETVRQDLVEVGEALRICVLVSKIVYFHPSHMMWWLFHKPWNKDPYETTTTTWWFQRWFIFTPKFREDEPFW